MVGFPYDDLAAWRTEYPPQVFVDQLELVAGGFQKGIGALEDAQAAMPSELKNNLGQLPPEWVALQREIDVARTAAIHFQSTANQSRFVMARDALAKATTAEAARPLLSELERLLKTEMDLARKLYVIQCRDSRMGFEASNQYNYVPIDMVEKLNNCRDLLDRWLPAQKQKWAK